jgi:drug/metabolite transporter (DMT)-like permease
MRASTGLAATALLPCYPRLHAPMSLPIQLTSAVYALGAVGAWGVSDFLGGYTAKRFNSFLLAAIGHAAGFSMVFALATASHLQAPLARSAIWAMLAGVSGGTALALFYQALAQGNMGLAAPVSTVIGAAIPAVFSIWIEGLPRPLAIAGFALALVGIWLISRPEDSGRPQGLGLAVVAGLGFAGFYIFMKQAGAGAAMWLASFSRGASLAITAIIVMAGRKFAPFYSRGAVVGALAGCLDVGGTVMFVRAEQTGRLDTAVVLTSLYPVVTIFLARMFLNERFTFWKTAGMIAALAAVPMIARG